MSEGPHKERFLELSVSRSVGEAPSLEAGIQAALEDVCEWADWVLGQAWIPTTEGTVERMPVSYVESEEFASFRDVSREFTFAPGEGIPGRVLESTEPVWFPDVSSASEEVYPRTAHAAAVGLQAGLGVPVVADGEVVVVLEFYLEGRREADERLVESVTAVAEEVGTLVARRRTEDALAQERKRQLEQYRALTDAANDVILTIDEESTIQTVNPTVADVFGHEPDELVGKSLTVLMPDGFAEQHREAIGRYLETGERTLDWDYVELPGRHADGSRIPLALSFSEVEFEGEQFFTGVVRDITERKERETELELFRSLIDHSHDAVFVIDPETGQFLDVNDTACRHLEYDRAELLEMTVLDVEANLSDQEGWQAHVDDLRSEGSLTFEGRHRRADGTVVPVEVSISDVDLDREYMLAVARDVTEQREYQRQLKASNERLEQFAYAASHDLQEPLRMVTSYLRLLESRYADELDEDAAEFIEFAVDGADRMREMIDGLLEYSRVGTQGEPFGPVDLDAIVDDVLADLGVKIEERDAEISVGDLPRVEGDAGQLRQLFQNLVDNAIEYTGDEPPRVDVTAEREGSEWVVSVRDEGVGIDPGDQKRIFEVFQRLHTHDEHAGSGIGLALSRRIVERHGGTIWVESDPGEGATFSVTLPAVGDD